MTKTLTDDEVRAILVDIASPDNLFAQHCCRAGFAAGLAAISREVETRVIAAIESQAARIAELERDRDNLQQRADIAEGSLANEARIPTLLDDVWQAEKKIEELF